MPLDSSWAFHNRLAACFGDRTPEFSEELIDLLYEFWRDGVCVGVAAPGIYEHDGTNRKLKILSHFGDRAVEFSDPLRGRLIELWVDAKDYGAQRMCARCGSREGIKLEDARTHYDHKEGEPDPNADIPYCSPCAVEHHEHWDEMWAEYNSGRL